MGRLESRVAVVTGGGRGLGRGVARRLAREGATIVIGDLDETAGTTTRDEIESELKVPCFFRRTDVGTEEDAKGLIKDAYDRYKRIDILVNAAQGFTAPAVIEEKPTEMYEYSYRTGVLGSLWTMQAAVEPMRELGHGRIVNFCSISGVMGEPLFSDYNITKEGIRGLTKTAAREWGRFGIRVNCIAPIGLSPAHVAHETMNPEFARRLRKAIALRYAGDPEEDIGGAALMLCSDESRFVTGMTIFADGGLHLLPIMVFDPDEWEQHRIDFNPAHEHAPEAVKEVEAGNAS